MGTGEIRIVTSEKFSQKEAKKKKNARRDIHWRVEEGKGREGKLEVRERPGYVNAGLGEQIVRAGEKERLRK